MAKKILDTGIIVGGAKKERVTTSSKENKDAKTKGLPQWLPKGIEVCLLTERNGCKKALRYEKFGDGPWGIYERSYFSWRLLGEGFETREEAVAKLPYLFWSKVLYIGCKGGVFCIYKRMRSAKQLLPCKDGFETEDDAKKYASEHAAELVVTRSLNPVLPSLKTVRRVGPDYREGRDITGEELCATFGLCGVEYGEWLPDKERQESLNSCFDAFCDLADVIKVERSAIGFHGLLAVAFGSRGTSKHDAHFDHARFIINLTRLKGAGNVAHEWFHAFDYFMGAKVKGIRLDRNDPALYYKTSEVETYSASGHEEGPFGELTKALCAHYMAGEEAKAFLEKQAQLAEKSFEAGVASYLVDIGGRCRIPATKVECEQAVQSLNHFRAWVDDKKLFRADLEALLQLYAKTNKVLKSQVNPNSSYYQLYHAANRYIEAVERGRSEVPTAYNGLSDFKRAAMDIDRGRRKPYWATTLELAARAFGAYVEDRLEDAGRISQFLVHSHKNDCYAKSRPYPQGDERIHYGRLFDELFRSWAAML